VSAIHFLSQFFPPLYISHITGVRSVIGTPAEGWFVACPFTPDRMMGLPVSTVYHKIVRTGQLAAQLGARILGLGAFTSVIGDAGITISKHLDIPVTTGSSYTVATAVQAVRAAAERLDLNLGRSTIAIVGAAGAVGGISARLLARHCDRMILIGLPRNLARLMELKTVIEGEHGAQTWVTTEYVEIRQADIVVTVTSDTNAFIEPRYLRPGAVVLDVARPRNVSELVLRKRDDVLVIEGGMVSIPGTDLDLGFDFGFPPRMAYACMAEVMILALEGRYESYTLGRNISIEQVQTIEALGSKHGFKVGGFRSFERPVTEQVIERVRRAAHRRRRFVPGFAPSLDVAPASGVILAHEPVDVPAQMA
jgi:predicted amino acid dehydrogenase